jgi:hypothetical protein
MLSQASSQRGHYPPDSILQVVHLVALPGRSDRKSLKLLDLEFANSIKLAESLRLFGSNSNCAQGSEPAILGDHGGVS